VVEVTLNTNSKQTHCQCVFPQETLFKEKNLSSPTTDLSGLDLSHTDLGDATVRQMAHFIHFANSLDATSSNSAGLHETQTVFRSLRNLRIEIFDRKTRKLCKQKNANVLFMLIHSYVDCKLGHFRHWKIRCVQKHAATGDLFCVTLPETNLAPEKWWLEKKYAFPIGAR